MDEFHKGRARCKVCRKVERRLEKTYPRNRVPTDPQKTARDPQEHRRRARKAGIRSEDVERAVLARLAATGCEVCGSDRMLSMDHDHATGRFRGILCSACNRALGALGDDVASLRRVLAYLLRNDPCTTR